MASDCRGVEHLCWIAAAPFCAIGTITTQDTELKTLRLHEVCSCCHVETTAFSVTRILTVGDKQILVGEELFLDYSRDYMFPTTTYCMARYSLRKKCITVFVRNQVGCVALSSAYSLPTVLGGFEKNYHHWKRPVEFLCPVDMILVKLNSCTNFADHHIARSQSLHYAGACPERLDDRLNYFHARRDMT